MFHKIRSHVLEFWEILRWWHLLRAVDNVNYRKLVVAILRATTGKYGQLQFGGKVFFIENYF